MSTMALTKWAIPGAGLLAALVVLAGCPAPSSYDAGLRDGFFEDDWYWQGYDDSVDSIDYDTIYYQGSEIPFVESPPYEAGYWDGVWYAYNDGYFTSYRYAFIIGFSEGYDNAYWPDYLTFLARDQHIEILNGGWVDGYHDGFSEGRVFGAYDFESGLPFDWLDAFLDYEDGVDLYFEEVDVGTGEFGPVILYEYGTDPLDLSLKARMERSAHPNGAVPAIRRDAAKFDPADEDLFRPMLPDVRASYQISPDESGRSDKELRLESTWLQRIEAYDAATKDGVTAKQQRHRASP
jgi:hypothetical protein